MQNFTYKNPVKYIFGTATFEKVQTEIPKNKRVLMVYGGGSIKQNGIYNTIKKALLNHTVFEFGGIQANPDYSILMEVVAYIKANKIDYILAVGGGSVIDGVKFIIAAIYFKGNPWDIVKNAAKIDKVLPYGIVLTLPATGSEMNPYAVISRRETGEKLAFGHPKLYAQFTINNPSVIASLPQRQLQNSIVDAFVHVMEQYLTYNHGALLQDRIAEGILQTLVAIAPAILANPKDEKLAANLMWSCTMALNGLLANGVPSDWATHTIGHELTALYGIDHARSLAIVAPNLYQVLFKTKKEKLTQYGKRVWNLQGTDTVIAQEAIVKTKQFFESLGVKTNLIDYNLTPKKVAIQVLKNFEKRTIYPFGEAKNITATVVQEILEKNI
jgi:NADP-dependent alcohol dehydrogenase